MIVGGEQVARFVSERLGFGLCPPFTAVGIERDGKIVAGVIFNHFEGADVHFTAAGSGWTRGFLCAIGEYVFGQLGCARMTAITRSDDVATLAGRLGGQIEGRMRNHFGVGQDGLVIGILRHEWRYATVRPSQARLTTTSCASCQEEANFSGLDPQGSRSDADGAGAGWPQPVYGRDAATAEHDGPERPVGQRRLFAERHYRLHG